MRKLRVTMAMIVLPLLGMIFLLAACGGSDDDDAEAASRISTLIEEPTVDESYSTVCNSVVLGGTPNYPASQWGGVTWTNATTGASGTAISGVQECWSIIFGSYPCNPSWWASVPLQLGSNRISVTASYLGGTETDTIIVTKPVWSYAVSGKVANHDGSGIFNMKVSRGDTGDFVFTDTDGVYTLSCFTAGTYTIAPTAMYFYSPENGFWSEMNWPFTPASQTVTIAGADATGVDFSTTVYRLQGEVMLGSINPTFPLEVELIGSEGERGRAAVNGGYFTLLAPNGTYTLQAPVSSIYSFTPATWSITVSGGDVTGLDFMGQAN